MHFILAKEEKEVNENEMKMTENALTNIVSSFISHGLALLKCLSIDYSTVMDITGVTCESLAR